MTTNCQTKYLSANTAAGTSGPLPDLDFSNLTTGKKYSIEVFMMSYAATQGYHEVTISNGAPQDIVRVWDGTTTTGTGVIRSTYATKTFTAVDATTVTEIAGVDGNNFIYGHGSFELYSRTTLCELPEIHLDTTQF
jgi:hypothetical protein